MNTVVSEEKQGHPAAGLEPLSDEADQTLVKRVQTGDADAFEALFRRYGPRVLRQALHLLGSEAKAEEVVQEVFLALYEKVSTFRGDARFSTWLYRLTANAALSRLRRRQHRPEASMDDYLPRFRDDGHHLVRPVVDWSQDLERHCAQAELRQLLWQAIEALAPLDRAVLVLSDFEELSNRDIGDVLGLSVPAVKARLHRARLCLRGKLAAALL
jgi:RNA polymerase sigma-70 factor (ECF subfamily)